MEMNAADPFLVGGDSLGDEERAVLIRLARGGGALPTRDLEWDVVRALLDRQAVTEAGPRGVALTVRGLQLLAEMADA
jgi:hypothetical protein